MSRKSAKDVYSQKHYLPRQYAEKLLIIEKGEGARLTDNAGRHYLDFASGIAVNALGYGRKDLARAIAEQAEKVIHTSNLFTTQPVLDLAEKICSSSPLPADQPWEVGKNPGYFAAVHFGNSGTESNEAAIKYARAWHYRNNRQRPEMLAFENSFHGRTMGALSLTFTKKYRQPFEPLIPGVRFARFNDLADLERHCTARGKCPGAIIVEPVQGEGGLHVMTREFAEALNRLCRERDILLIADEVQTGLGRCGTLYASEAIGLEPDIITLSKPLAGGLPLSATIIKEKINNQLQIGDHASTFGGGPVTTLAGNMLWDRINSPAFLPELRKTAAYLEERLLALRNAFPAHFAPEAARGLGLLRGLAMTNPAHLPTLIDRAMDEGLLLLRSGGNILRLAPPLIISSAEIDEMENKLYTVLSTL